MWLSDLGSIPVTAASWVTAMVQVQSMGGELPHSVGAAKKEKKKKVALGRYLMEKDAGRD